MNPAYNVRIQTGEITIAGHLNTSAARVEAIMHVYIDQWLKSRSPRAPLRLQVGETVITVAVARMQ